MEEKAAKCVLAFAEDGKERYRNFRNERFVEKSLKLVIQSKPKALQQPYNSNQKRERLTKL